MSDAAIIVCVPFEISTNVKKCTAVFRNKIQCIVYWRSRLRDPPKVSNPVPDYTVP